MAEASKVKKNLVQVAILIATFLVALPTTPIVSAAPAPAGQLLITPGVNNAENGEFFGANVTFCIASSQKITGFDVRITYNPDILQILVTGNELGFTLLDLNHSGDITTDPVLVARADVFNTIGFARFAAVTLGGAFATTGPQSKCAPLVRFLFAASFASFATASELPSAIGLQGLVVGLDSAGNTINIPTTITSGVYEPSPPALASVGCRATIQGFNTVVHGTSAGVFCRVFNPSDASSVVQANFAFEGLVLPPGVASSLPITLAPGQAATLTASIDVTASGTSDIVIVTGTPVRSLPMPDGTTAMLSGASSTFKIVING